MIYTTTTPKESLAIFTQQEIIILSHVKNSTAYDTNNQIIDPYMFGQYRIWVFHGGDRSFATDVELPLTHEEFLQCRSVRGEPGEDLKDKFEIYIQYV